MHLFESPQHNQPEVEGKPEILEGSVHRLVYHNTDNGYTVLRMLHNDREITAVGSTLGITEGESIRLHGSWVKDPRYGRQFSFDRYEMVRPTTREAMVSYLGSGLFTGIGPAMARRLVDLFGENTLEVLDHAPDRLTEVQGIGKMRAEALCRSWREAEHAHRVMVFLQQHGLGPALAARIYERFGGLSMSIIEQEPYRLADEVYGVGFLTADRIARISGVSAEDPARLLAGLKYTLDRGLNEGHLFLPRPQLLGAAVKLLQVSPERIEEQLERAVREEEIELEVFGDVPAYYLPQLLKAEKELAGLLTRLAHSPVHKLIKRNALRKWQEQRSAMGAVELSEEQLAAVELAINGPFTVITGGPGTGKTTVTRAICDACDTLGWRVALCSPTGRAAKRLSQLSGKPASTIHRLLAYDPRERHFVHDLENPLQIDVLVCDETSMVDVLLARDLLMAVKPGTRVVLIGDADQLPSVGPGTFFKDVVAAGAVPVAVLRQIFRQEAGGDIVANAHLIRNGEMPHFTPGRDWDGQDTVFMERTHPDQVAEAVLRVVTSGLAQLNYAADDIQVLTPMHRGPAGVGALNKALQEHLNPSAPGKQEVRRGDHVFREGDRVLQNVNNYDKEVYNGDVGRVVAIDSEEGYFGVEFDQGQVAYEANELDQLQLAYALTVHKSQGSEYPAVIIVVHSTHYIMLQRNLLYTALTRASSMAVIIGDTKGVATAVRRADELQRYTYLQQRLRGELPKDVES